MRGLEYKKFSNPLQQKLKEDCQKIAQNADLLVPADKTRNYYSLEKEKYKELINKDIQKSYKKASDIVVESVDIEQRTIVESLDLTCQDLCQADGRHIQSTMARTQV